ncbi:MAG: carbohydrate porin [Endomicrobium sp.]|uniref:carbohydrate porin n=1 Tax=Candidatus Endomicrobiellum pyrsonymphae TaxID=1408203 RepID=UPI003575AE98|nr:carbohydrate porin [Endomicrobium sp.]
MKKFFSGCIVFVLVYGLFLSQNVFAATTAEEIALLKDEVAKLKIANCCCASRECTLSSLGLTSEGYGTFVVQGTPKTNTTGKHAVNSSLLYGWSLTKKVSEDSLVYMRIKGAVGSGLNNDDNNKLNLDLYSNINSAASPTGDNLQIVEFLYHQDLFNKKLQLLFGKLNPTAYFDGNKIANDETTQFLASMFCNNPAIAFPSYTLGLRAMYSPVSFLDIEYGYFSQDDKNWNNIDKHNFNIVEGTYKISDTGNYRFMYWKTFGNEEKTFGYGLSFDQSLSKIITLFARYGHQNPQKTKGEACNILDSWSFGAQLNGGLWTRDMDKIGIAFGQNIPSKKWATSWNWWNRSTTPETQTECYYSFYLNNNVTLTPVVQCIFKPYGGKDYNDNICTFGIRTNITF